MVQLGFKMLVLLLLVEGGLQECQHGQRNVIVKGVVTSHCTCSAESPICRGSHCSTGSVSCDRNGACTTVHSFLESCTDCVCVPSADHHLLPPEQVFVTLSGIDGELTVNFAVSKAFAEPRVRYGPRLDEQTHEVLAEQQIDPDYDTQHISLWTAVIPRISSDRIHYQVCNGADICTLPFLLHVPHPTCRMGMIGVVGDIGLSYSAPMVMQALLHDEALEMLIHPGDISYAFNIDGMNRYLDKMQPLVSRMPYMTLLGNHEANNEKVLRAYSVRFPNHILANNSGSNTSHWYSYDAYGIHFIHLDSQDDVHQASAQHRWLEKDLEAAAFRRRSDKQGSAYPWIAVVLHYPMYSSFTRAQDVHRANKPEQMKCLREGLEELLLRYEVDFVIAGHDHMYERSVSQAQGKAADSGIVHLTVGTGGHNIYESWAPQPAYTAVRMAVPGFATFMVHDDCSLTWTFNEVDISPCKRAYEGGRSSCPSQLIDKSKGTLRPKLKQRDVAHYRPRSH